MFVISLFPGSGDTYLSYIFNSIYNLNIVQYEENSLKKGESQKKFEKDIIKTNLLPSQIPQSILGDKKVIYLIRDGRDAINTIAHYRKNSIDSFSNVSDNIEEATVASEGSYNGGWSAHVDAWSRRADIIVKFEDLISNPIAVLEKINNLLPLPAPQLDKLEQYDSVVFGDHMQPELSLESKKNITPPKGWQEDFNDFQKALFLKYHTHALVKVGYHCYEEIASSQISEYYSEIFNKIISVNSLPLNKNQEKIKVLIEGSKLLMPYNDGIKRYVVELIKSLQDVVAFNSHCEIDVFDGNAIVPIGHVDLDYYLNLKKRKLSPFQWTKKSIVTLGKDTLKSTLSVDGYQDLGIYYKTTKARFKQSQFSQKIFSTLLFIQTKLFSNRIKFVSTAKPFNTDDYDLIHIPLLQHVEFINQAKEKALITLHDLTHLSHPQFHEVDNVILANQGLKLCIQNQVPFLAISDSTYNDFVNTFSTDFDITTIQEAAESKIFCPLKSEYWVSHIRANFGLPKDAQFFVSVSTLEPRKNLKNAILAFQLALDSLPENVYFLVVGKVGWKMKEVLPENIELSPRIIFTGFVEEEYLPWIYREALALIYISHYEGFGLPLLEAMSCKIPVIFGYNSSMIEIVGDTGYPVQSDDVNAIRKSILQLVKNKEEYKEKSLQSLIRSNDFTWQKTALLTLGLYKKRINELQKTSKTEKNFTNAII